MSGNVLLCALGICVFGLGCCVALCMVAFPKVILSKQPSAKVRTETKPLIVPGSSIPTVWLSPLSVGLHGHPVLVVNGRPPKKSHVLCRLAGDSEDTDTCLGALRVTTPINYT